MTAIRSYRKQARARATANGTSHQTELNAIARENGHLAWGSFQKHLNNAAPPSTTDGEDDELDDLMAAFQAARAAGGHLVVLRPDKEAERASITLLTDQVARNQADPRLESIAFAEALDAAAIKTATADGRTIVAGSGSMPRTTTRGQFIVRDPAEKIDQINALHPKRENDLISATLAVEHVLPTADATIPSDRTGRTTIRHPMDDRSAPSTVFRSIDKAGTTIELDWNMPSDQRDPGIAFTPAYNALGSGFLPTDADALERHLDRLVHILLPEDASGYFETKGRHVMIGFLLVEIGRAADRGRTPSIPALIDWIRAGMRDVSEERERRRTMIDETDRSDDRGALSDWLRSVVIECHAKGYHERAAAEITPLISMHPKERAGVLGTMDKGFIPFKNHQVRERTS